MDIGSDVSVDIPAALAGSFDDVADFDRLGVVKDPGVGLGARIVVILQG